jgi:hypothetical protein
MAGMTYPEVLNVAQQLSPEAQLELAETLLHNLRTMLSRQEEPSDDNELSPLVGLSHTELRALADAVVAADRQQQLQTLLAKNRQGTLTPEEEQTLDKLLAEADQVALLKARALYTIQILGLTVATN